MRPKCQVAGCVRESHGRNLCSKHYQRWKNHGDPLAVQDMRPAGSGNLRKRDGYIVHNKDGENILEHVQIAERALGKPLPAGAQVHHWDKNRSNNTPSNLVVCPDQPYHRLLHRRMDALEACGNPNWMPCRLCKAYDDPKNMYVYPGGTHAYHRECSAKYARDHRSKQSAAPQLEAA